VGWFRVERGGAACTLVLVYVSIRLSETVSEFRSIERFRTQDTGHRTTDHRSASIFLDEIVTSTIDQDSFTLPGKSKKDATWEPEPRGVWPETTNHELW